MSNSMFRFPPDDEDLKIIRGQLGGAFVFASSVAARCPFGFPSVIALDISPGDKEKEEGLPFRFMSLSNLLWLTCPWLNDRIHEIENRGFIRKIETLINDDRELAEKMFLAHASFYYLRKKTMEHCCGSIDDTRALKALNSGVGGIREPGNLKCLHVHYGHTLAGGSNPAGDITGRILGCRRDCGEALCGRFK